MIERHITHVSPRKRDVAYDPLAQQAALPVQVHYVDGTTVDTLLILAPGEVELFRTQADQAIAKRTAAGVTA
ncbi:hypothetical protein [Streptacidiphilus albus]|uniref:hypothetical protein n=1 Tax=Streptacidiphilus albus TaxID=105425 RepID=UPI00054C643E|nr:hypothetical protein [Streptacidiphilus albus]